MAAKVTVVIVIIVSILLPRLWMFLYLLLLPLLSMWGVNINVGICIKPGVNKILEHNLFCKPW